MDRPPSPSPPARATVPGPVRDTLRRDCTHRGAPHRHGTRAAYVSDRCGCTRCRVANRDAETRRVTAIAAGNWAPYTDSTSVRRHLAALRQHGIGVGRIAQLSGVPVGTVRRLAPDSQAGPHRIRTGTAQRLLAVPLAATAASARRLVAADNTRRRITELTAAGHTVRDLAHLIGKTADRLRRSLSRRFVTAATAAAVATLHATLTNDRRPSNPARRVSAVRRPGTTVRPRGSSVPAETRRSSRPAGGGAADLTVIENRPTRVTASCHASAVPHRSRVADR